MNRRHFLATSSAAALALAARAAEPERKLRVGVIGHTGRGNYGHGLDTMWSKIPETEIVAVADADAKGLAAALGRLRVAAGFADYRKMLAETKPDLVAVGPRHLEQHHDMVMAAIEAGARGIYLEKPFCRTLAEADEIVAACEKRQVKCAIAHRNRYHPALPVIDAMVRDGAIGRLLELRARGKEDARGGALDLWVLGSHLVNLAQFFAGAARSCSAVVMQDGRPVTRGDVREGDEGVGPIAGNQVSARYDMERGVPLFFDSVQNAGTRAAGFGLQLIGTEGVIDLRIDQQPIAHLLKGSPFNPTQEPRAWMPIGTAGAGVPEPVADLGAQVSSHAMSGRDLLAALRENRAPLCSAQEGRAAVEMIAAVFESHRLDGRRVSFPLKTREHPWREW